jgi:hypothetical protein
MPLTNRISRDAANSESPIASGENGYKTSRLTAIASHKRLRTKICAQVKTTPATRASRSVRHAIERCAR